MMCTLRRWEMDLMGRPERCCATGCPGTVLSMYVVMWNCSSCANSWMMCCGAPDCSIRPSRMLAFTISDSLCVRSSSDLQVSQRQHLIPPTACSSEMQIAHKSGVADTANAMRYCTSERLTAVAVSTHEWRCGTLPML